ncbi:MAG: DUF3368 domain-containing protein [Kiritimatiellae bacterium]|nr:DUF3368 domain-containing protein [Kiritimatiellia bacterium]
MPYRKHLVFDSVVLSNFALAGELRLLLRLYVGRGLITTEVLDEIGHGVAVGYGELRAVLTAVRKGELRPASLTSRERVQFQNFLQTLSAGEASCLAVAIGKARVVATDDRAARTLCADLGISVTGTLGILLAARQCGALSEHEADRILAVMIERGFYSPIRSLRDIT